MIVNFLIDSRYGGPQMILGHLKSKLKIKKKTIYFDVDNKNFFFSNVKKIHKIFYIFDIIFNLLILIKNYYKFKKDKIFFVFSIVNVVPILLGIILKKKIVWYILEKPNLIFYFVFKILNLYPNLKIICISNSIAKMLKLQKYYLYFPTINQIFWKKNINTKLNKSNKSKNIVCIGNLNKTKNHLQLIKFLESTNLKYKLIIVGKKLQSQQNYFKKLVEMKDKVNFSKFNKIDIFQNKKSKFIKKILNNSDIFILPSLEEGLSIALVEAMSMEKLCLVSKSSNHSKIIINNNNGYEFDLNEKSFKKILNKIYKLNIRNEKKITKKARRTVIKLISKNVSFEKNVINKLLSSHP